MLEWGVEIGGLIERGEGREKGVDSYCLHDIFQRV